MFQLSLGIFYLLTMSPHPTSLFFRCSVPLRHRPSHELLSPLQGVLIPPKRRVFKALEKRGDLVGGAEAISPGVSGEPASHVRASGGGGLSKSSSQRPHHTTITRGAGAAEKGQLLIVTTLPPSFSLGGGI